MNYPLFARYISLAPKICFCLFDFGNGLFGVFTFPAFLLCKAILSVLVSTSCIEKLKSHTKSAAMHAKQLYAVNTLFPHRT